MRRSLLVAFITSAIVAAAAMGCNGNNSAAKHDVIVETSAVPEAKKLDAPPAAIHLPDAPGLNVEDLSARLRIAVARTSGLDVVDELSVKGELAACTEAPCPDTLATQFRDAAFIVASSISRVGNVFLTSVRVERGAQEIVRTTAQAGDARVSVEQAGLEAGAQLRKKLVAEGAAERVNAPVTPDAPPPAELGDDDKDKGSDQ